MLGSISMDAVQQELLIRSLTQDDTDVTAMTINLDSAAGGKQWGRLQCRLDASALEVSRFFDQNGTIFLIEKNQHN